MLSKHLAQTLKPLVGNTDFTVKNSLDFCDQIKHVKLKEGDGLVSFNVVSLFTPIPVELAIQVAANMLSKVVLFGALNMTKQCLQIYYSNIISCIVFKDELIFQVQVSEIEKLPGFSFHQLQCHPCNLQVLGQFL